MKIVGFEANNGVRLGVVDGDNVVDLQAVDGNLSTDLAEVLRLSNGDLSPIGGLVKKAPASARRPLDGLKYALPVAHPGKIIAECPSNHFSRRPLLPCQPYYQCYGDQQSCPEFIAGCGNLRLIEIREADQRGSVEQSSRNGGGQTANDSGNARGGNEKYSHSGMEERKAIVGNAPRCHRQQKGNDPRDHAQASGRRGIHSFSFTPALT